MKTNGNRRFELMMVGLGGRGVQLLSRILTEAGMAEYEHVICLGNYAPVVRGGSSESTLVLSDQEISSPIMFSPQACILMAPEFMAPYEQRMSNGGILILDSSVISNKVTKAGVKPVYIPATDIASKMGSMQVANMVLMGAWVALTGAVAIDSVDGAIDKLLGGKRAEVLALDKKAVREGMKLAGAKA
ncbi:MAG: 2-oxoacid:acceptor oxidoreductase family protein [Dehalococcoidia bacterium]|nr:2-oxoacid:acceptor oxidoreductase family protein [Dehalococcoidia bacterium]